jgi:hypothetical protein
MKETLKRIMMDKVSQLIEETTTDEFIEMFQDEVFESEKLELDRDEVVEFLDREVVKTIKEVLKGSI